MTLNPAAAPACVRCNTPLTALPAAPDPAATGLRPAGHPGPATAGGGVPPDPTVGAKQIGPGLAAPGQAAPGSSRAAAATVQPPGYGPPEPAPTVTDPNPVDLRRARHRIAVAGLLLVALVLAGGGGALWLTRPRYVDTAAVAATVGAQLTVRLDGEVTVECPDGARRRAGETFGCTATDTGGLRRTVTVTLLDDAGRYRWRLGP